MLPNNDADTAGVAPLFISSAAAAAAGGLLFVVHLPLWGP